jgi:hypothetical protein
MHPSPATRRFKGVRLGPRALRRRTGSYASTCVPPPPSRVGQQSRLCTLPAIVGRAAPDPHPLLHTTALCTRTTARYMAVADPTTITNVWAHALGQGCPAHRRCRRPGRVEQEFLAVHRPHRRPQQPQSPASEAVAHLPGRHWTARFSGAQAHQAKACWLMPQRSRA